MSFEGACRNPYAAAEHRLGVDLNLTGMIVRAIEALLAWHERSTQRRLLLSLSDQMLKDVGLSRADAWQEGNKPFWRS